MTPAVEILFHELSEKGFYPYLDIPEYDEHAQVEENLESRLKQLLPPEQAELLDELIQARIHCASIEQEAAFQAGIAVGLELSRL